MLKLWKLNGHEVVVEPDLQTWARWYETADRRVALDDVGARRISTVFLGIDHSFGYGAPLLFETMIFPLDSYEEERCERYPTWDEAEAGHRQIVTALQKEI